MLQLVSGKHGKLAAAVVELMGSVGLSNACTVLSATANKCHIAKGSILCRGLSKLSLLETLKKILHRKARVMPRAVSCELMGQPMIQPRDATLTHA